MTELELKFGVPGDVHAPLRRALRERGARRVRLQAHYFDTADGLLASQQVALRVRREGRHWVQAIKAPGEGAVHRLEHELRLDAPAGGGVPLPDLRRHADGPAAPRVAALLAARAELALVERHGTDISRLLCEVAVGATRVEVAFDRGSASAGGQRVAIEEVELEYKGGPVAGLFELAAAWVAHGGLWLSTINKAQRGDRLLRGATAPVATRWRPPALRAGADAAAILRALLQSALEQVLANASEIAEGGVAADTVHQLRVGLRRLRTVLRELAAWSPRIDPAWDGALGAACAQLGRHRDPQAVGAAVRPLLESARAPRLAWQPPALPDPQAVVRDRGLQLTLLAILALAHADDAAGGSDFAAIGPAAARSALAARLSALHRQVQTAARRFERLSADQQHRARKRLRRLRYLADFTAGLWPPARLQRYVKRLGQAQAALGAHNDVTVGAQAFRDEASRHPEAWFAAGWLQAHGAVTARAARKALQRVAAARAFWR